MLNFNNSRTIVFCFDVLGENVNVKVAQSCLTVCDQARVLEQVAFPLSRGSSQPRDRTQVFRIVGGLPPTMSHQEVFCL